MKNISVLQKPYPAQKDADLHRLDLAGAGAAAVESP